PILILCSVKIFIFRNFVIKKIGGMTGDTLGAANEIAELSFLLYIFFFERLGIKL
ncbi:MAG: adenosylcobinamide-GDP ribazoletransferase, partial [Clostridiales bacterium]|nr:adenosylcobinamide-GDP ribazoletransferase [Clostridiales bacterium]